MKFNSILCKFVIALLIGCSPNQPKVFYNDEFLEEIEGLIISIIETDSIEVYFPDYKIYSYLPKYVLREQIDFFQPGPPPKAPNLFPDINSELGEVVGIGLSKADVSYFKEQEVRSEPLELSDTNFGTRKTLLSEDLREIKYPYIYYSIPIFNATRDVAWIMSGIDCGWLCGEGKTIILKKKNGRWEKIFEKIDWVS